jgi:hypothetical protein
VIADAHIAAVSEDTTKLFSAMLGVIPERASYVREQFRIGVIFDLVHHVIGRLPQLRMIKGAAMRSTRCWVISRPPWS